MTSHCALDTLIELATTATDEAAQRLGRALKTADEAQKKLTLLQQYREEYAQRFQSNLGSGLSPVGYSNFRQFIEKLDQAVAGQQTIVEQAQAFVSQERGQWQACERKRISFDTLASRADKVAQAKESRRDQKMMDEFAARALRARR